MLVRPDFSHVQWTHYHVKMQIPLPKCIPTQEKSNSKNKTCSKFFTVQHLHLFMSHMFDLYNPLSCLSYFIYWLMLHKCLDSMFQKKKIGEFNSLSAPCIIEGGQRTTLNLEKKIFYALKKWNSKLIRVIDFSKILVHWRLTEKLWKMLYSQHVFNTFITNLKW